MYDIFLSYSTQDRQRLQPLFHALEKRGWSVFWDHRTIDIGDHWSKKINHAIRTSKCVLVVWSENSIESEWVLEEANIGKQREVLLPIRIDEVILPVGFTMRQTGNFVGWVGDLQHSEFIRLVEKIAELLASHQDLEQAARKQREGVVAEEAASRIAEVKQAQPLLDSPTLDGVSPPFWKKHSFQLGSVAVAVVAAVVYMQQLASVPPPAEPAVSAQAAVSRVKPPEPEALPFEPEMIDILAAGSKPVSFTMGCKQGRDDVEGGCDGNEKPEHKVTLTQPYKLAKTEVTVAQFRAFVEAKGYKTTAEKQGSCWSLDAKGDWDEVKGNSWRKLGFKQGDDHPVACVSWEDANAYVAWLSKETEKSYRLPTEAEWEYAARGGQEGAYPWGQSIGKNNANCSGDLCGDKFEYTSPVGSFAANPFGLHDMHGNVWEWVSDRYGAYAAEPQQDPQGADKGASRVLRGGSWSLDARYARSAYRSSYTPDDRFIRMGFRPAQGQ